jgi:hypothetical protein
LNEPEIYKILLNDTQCLLYPLLTPAADGSGKPGMAKPAGQGIVGLTAERHRYAYGLRG